MPQPVKWIEVSPTDPVDDVVRQSLLSRLSPLQKYLRLAATRSKQNVEYVHQLRVWSRRAQAAVELYGDFVPRRRARWILRQLKRILRATSESRDDDVCILRLKSEKRDAGAARLLKRVRADRRRAQRSIRKVYRRLMYKKRFPRRVRKLVKRSRWRGEPAASPLQFGPWSALQLQSYIDAFLIAGRADFTDHDNLHQFRIQGKKLRYAMELLAAAFPEQLRASLYPCLSEMQDKLGKINDHATAVRRLQRWLREADKPKEVKYLERTLCAEQQLLETSRQAFFDWWSPARRNQMEAVFGQLTRPDSATADLPTASHS